jgi:hypothetical protein
MSRPVPARLRDLAPPARLGLICMILTLLGGTAASGLHLYWHHQNRDERPGLTIDDIRGHYHGIISPAPLLESIERGHPVELGVDLPGGERAALIAWLKGDRVSGDYDNLDLGDLAPSEIMAANCLDCHSRASSGEHAAPRMPLEYWDDIAPLSVSRQINPVSTEILAASTHTHALGLAAVTLVLAWLALLTSWPRTLIALLVGLTGLGLMADIGAWWLTRRWIEFAWVILGAGAAYNGGMVLLGLAVIADLVMPGKNARGADS